MIKLFVNKTTMLAVRQGAITDEEIPVFRYGIQAMSEVLMITATILFISLQIGRLAEACVLIGCVILSRSYGRGYHAQTFARCYLISCLIFSAAILTIDLMPSILCFSVSVVCAAASLLIFITLFIIAKPEDKRYHKINKIIHITFFILFIYACYFSVSNSVFTACSFGFIISQISMLIKHVEERIK